MSIHTLKVKSNRFQNKISGGINNPNGFSLVGGHRNLPYVGQTSLSKSVTRTPFRGNLPMGHGGNNGKFKISIVNSGSCCFNDPNIIKKSVGNSKYAIIHKNKWLHSAYPRLITKQVEITSQSDYIKKLSINNSKCTQNIDRGLQYFIYSGTFPLVDEPSQDKSLLDSFRLSAPLIKMGASLNFSNLYNCTNAGINDINLDNFSVYLRGYFRPIKTGQYTFSTVSDDACVVYVNSVLTVNDVALGANHAADYLVSGQANLVAGNYYLIEIYYKESTGEQALSFGYKEPGAIDFIYDTTNLYSYFQELPPTDNKILGELNCDNIENGDRCRQRSHYIGGKKYVSSLYFKTNKNYAVPSSDYQREQLMKKRDLPTPDCKLPFPFVIPNNNKVSNLGNKYVWFKTPQQAVQSGYLPSDWMNCNIYKNSECLYGNYKYR